MDDNTPDNIVAVPFTMFGRNHLSEAKEKNFHEHLPTLKIYTEFILSVNSDVRLRNVM